MRAGPGTPVPPKARLGNVDCSSVTIAEFVAEIRALLLDTRAAPRVFDALNAHIFNLAQRDEDLRARLNRCRVLAADGMAVVWALRLLGANVRERCNMTEAFGAFLDRADMPRTTAILLGCTAEQAARAARRAQDRSGHCRIVRAVSGFLPEGEYRAILAGADAPDLVLLGLGSPKSERIADLAAEVCPRAVVWHIGGGTILFYADAVREAPVWMRRSGLQWLHRLAMEPRRMWKRYVFGNPRFVLHVLRAAWRRKSRAGGRPAE